MTPLPLRSTALCVLVSLTLTLLPACAPNSGSGPVVVQPRLSINCGLDGSVSAIAVADDGHTAIVQGTMKNNNVQIWDLSRQTRLHVLDNDTPSVRPVGITPDAKLAAFAYYSGGLAVVDVRTGSMVRELRVWDEPLGLPCAIRLTPEGDVIVIAADKRIVGWDLKNGEVKFAWDADATEVSTLSEFFDGGRKIASGNYNGEIKVWDVGSGKPVQTLAAGRQKILSLAVTPDGKTMASAELSGPLKVWDLPNGREVRFGDRRELAAGIQDLQFLRGGELLAYIGRGRVIVVEETVTGAKRYQLVGHTKEPWSLAPLPGGSSLASVGGDTIHVWDLK